MPRGLGGLLPDALQGFRQGRLDQQAVQESALKRALIQMQMEQAAEDRPLKQELLRAQIEELKAKPDRQKLETALKLLQFQNEQEKANRGRQQSQAATGLASLLSQPYQAPGAPPPNAVVGNDQQAIDMLRNAQGPMRVDVPNPANVQALSVLADPQRAIPEILRQQRPNQAQQRPTVLNPGAGLVPPGATAPVYTQPTIPRADQETWGDPYEGPGGSLLQRSSRGQIRSVVGREPQTREPMSDEAVRDLAIQSLYDSSVLAGYRRDTQVMSRIADARVKVMKESGVNSQDVVSGRAGFKADTASLNKITPQYDAITAFEQTAIRNGRILIDLANVVDKTGVPVIERWIRAGRQATGDPDVAKFNAQLHVYRAEAARILTQPNLSGILTDTAREEMAEFLKPGASAEQIKQTVQLLERDFLNRKQTLEDQIVNIRQRMNQRVAPGTANASPAAPAPTTNKKLIYDPATGTFK